MTSRHIMIGMLLWLAASAGIAAEPTAADPPAPSVRETMAAVGQISHELKQIEARLGRMEGSIAGVDKSLASVGALSRPETLRGLILLATACGAGLVVLNALLRRWSAPPRQG